MLTVSALSALNEQIWAEIHMHVSEIAVLPEKKMVSRGYADHFTDIYCSLKITIFPYFMVKFAFG